jgi:hypothetical protein
VAHHDRARHQAAPTVAPPATPRAAEVTRHPPLAALQRLAGNRAVAQLVAAAPVDTSVDPKARVDQLQLAIRIEVFPQPRLRIDLDKAVEALTDLTSEDGRAIKAEYKRRTRWDLGWVISGLQDFGDGTLDNTLARAERTRLLNLLGGTVAMPTDPAQTAATAALVGNVVSGVSSMFGVSEQTAAVVSEQAAAAMAAGTAAEEQRRAAAAETSRYRAEAAQVRRAIERKQADAAIALIRRPDAERQALANQYQVLYGESLYNALTTRLSGRDRERAAAIWIGDMVTADRLALEGDLERQTKVEAETREAEELASAFPSVGDAIKAKRREARTAVEARLAGIAAADQPDTASGRAAGREHLAQVLGGTSAAGATLDSRVRATGDRVAEAIIDQGEPEQLAARFARADTEGTLTSRDLEAGIRELRVLARRAAIREIMHQPAALAPQQDRVLQVITDGYYQRFRDHFDEVATKRKLDQALGMGSAVDAERNRALLAEHGSLPAWRELDLALRRSPKDMDRVRHIMEARTREEMAALAEEYQANTTGHRSLRADLLGTPVEQQMAEFVDRDKAAADLAEKRVLLQGGEFSSSATDEATRLDEERRWLFGRFIALERAVIENRGTFAEVRDWLGNIEKALVDQAHADAADASSAMARALTDSPPDLAAAREALVGLRQATARIERNLATYKEATKAAFDEFVDLAVLAVTTIVTAGQGTAVMMAIRATVATVGTKLALKGSDYQLDEFLMDLRSGLGAAAGGKLVEGVLKPVAQQVATYAGKTGLSRGFAGRVLPQLGEAGMWELEHLTTTLSGNVATGQDLTTGMGVEGQANALIQHGVTTGIRGMRGEPGPTGGQERPGRTPGEEGLTRPTEEGAARPTTRASGVSIGADIVDQVAGAGPMTEAVPSAGGPEAVAAGPRVPMQLPEATSPRPTRDEHTVRSTEKEVTPTPDELTGPDTIPDETGPGPDETLVEPSPNESERSRRTRRDQAERAERYRGDQETLRTTTAPDARSRALARDFAALYPDWPELHPTQRLERLERIVNARLAEAGVPHVFVELGGMAPGNAEFSMREWKIRVSTDSLETGTPSLEAFAALCDAAAHEARHALHMFRGYRAAMASGTYRSGQGISPMAEVAARDANSGHRPAESLEPGSPAFQEALDLHREFYGSSPAAKRRRQNDRALAKVRYRIRQLQAELAREPAGSPRHAQIQRQLTAARRRQDRVHDTYISSAHEVDAWRMGSSTRAAVIEHVTRERIASLEQARARAEADGARAMARIAEREAKGHDTTRVRELVDDAIARERRAEEEIERLEGQLEAAEAIRRGEVAPASEVWPAHEVFPEDEG